MTTPQTTTCPAEEVTTSNTIEHDGEPYAVVATRISGERVLLTLRSRQGLIRSMWADDDEMLTVLS